MQISLRPTPTNKFVISWYLEPTLIKLKQKKIVIQVRSYGNRRACLDLEQILISPIQLTIVLNTISGTILSRARTVVQWPVFPFSFLLRTRLELTHPRAHTHVPYKQSFSFGTNGPYFVLSVGKFFINHCY